MLNRHSPPLLLPPLPLLLLVLLVLSPTVALRAEQPTYYAIKINDALIGHAVVNRDKVSDGGRELLYVDSQTTLKVSLLGKIRNTRLVAETWFDPNGSRPVRYRMTDTTNDVVSHVETEFDEHTARTWSYRDGQPRGTPVETKIPDDTVILGNNDFAHWRHLMNALAGRVVDGKASVPVFLPSAAKVDSFVCTRGETTHETLAGTEYECVVWSFPKAHFTVLTEAQTNRFLRLHLPAQQTTIELTDAGVVQRAAKARPQDLLARHFCQSNVLFDDFLKVEQLKAKIDVRVIGSGPSNTASVLTTAIQTFEGGKNGDHITGVVSIKSVDYDRNSYDQSGGPEFPTQGEDPELAPWLKPAPFIESTDPSIVKLAGELTADATTRWDAVQRIGEWVHEEIAYAIAGSPSAQLALEKRKGDCGPHATLMVAMLRCCNIPARLVGGVVYTPMFGGSFGQHAWVEVHVGKAGWIALDPTTGELERLSATHIKLFEGMGGVVPTTIEVLTFAPPNREIAAVRDLPVRKLAWRFDTPYTFRFTQGENELGTETFTISKTKQGDDAAYRLKSELKLTVSPVVTLQSSTSLVVRDNATPLAFEREFSVANQKTKIVCAFEPGLVKEEVSGTKSLSREIKIPAGAFCFDNNLMGSFVLICSQLKLEPGKPITIQAFHPSSMQIIPLTITPKPLRTIEVSGIELECFECDVAPIKNVFYITRDGRFVRATQGGLTIELVRGGGKENE